MEVYYFTFGTNHLHPLGGYSMGNFWVEVLGTYEEARAKMINRFGLKWSMQYSKEEFNSSYFPGGCHDVIE